LKKINLSELGKMLNAAFDGTRLETLAFDIDMELHSNITHLGKSKKIIEIIKFAAQQGKLETVIKFTKDHNAHQYGQFAPFLYKEKEQIDSTQSSTPNLTPVSDQENKDVTEITTEMISLMREMVTKGMGNQFTINAEKVNLATKGGSVTDNSKKYTIGNVGDGATISQGDSAQAISDGVSKSSAPDDVKVAIQKMLKALQKLNDEVENASSDDVISITKNSKRLAEDVADKSLKEKGANTYIDSLKKAASNIGELAKPVLDSAVAVIAALKATGVF
jgi:hypothetical protein